MAYTIYNPSAGDDYYDNAGTATTSSTQPTQNYGASTGATSFASALLNAVSPGDLNSSGLYGAQVVRHFRTGVISCFITATGVVSTSVADSGGGFCKFTKATHGLSVGDILYFSGATANSINKIHKITAKDASTFTTNVAYEASATSGTYNVDNLTIRFASMTAGQYVVRRGTTNYVAGVANNVLRSGTSNYGIYRSINKTEHGQTTKVTTALRAGKWNSVTGTWDNGYPAHADDSIGNVAGSTVTDGTADHAALPTQDIPGELVYRTGAPTATQGDYPARYLW